MYQHFPRIKREIYIVKRAAALTERLKAPWIGVLQTPHVAFFLAPREEHSSQLLSAMRNAPSRWDGKVRIVTWPSDKIGD